MNRFSGNKVQTERKLNITKYAIGTFSWSYLEEEIIKKRSFVLTQL